MPIYEYVCEACRHPFEELVRGDERVRCPSCDSERVEKRFSTFATRSASEPAAAPGACGRCGDPRGPGACSA